jgi:hypothetical protein
MKRLNYLPIAILTIAPVTAFAHKVPYGASHCAMSEVEADFEEIPLCSEEEKEKSAALAFCAFTGRRDAENCAESVVNNGMADAAAKCVDEAMQAKVDRRDQLVGHKKGGNHGSPADGYWHTQYEYSKEDGWHRHDWSAIARDKAGIENGVVRVEAAKRASAKNKSTTETSTSTSFMGKFLLSIGLRGIGGVDHEAGVDHTNTNGSSTENGPISEADAKAEYKAGYERGYALPNITSVNPDIVCERGKPNCGNALGETIPNNDKPVEAKKPDNNQPSGSPGNSSGGGSSGGKDSVTPTPILTPSRDKSTTDVAPKPDLPDVYVGEAPSVTKPGEILANFDQEDLNNPVSRCLMEELKEQVSKDMNRTYDPNSPGLTPAQRKKEAEGLLRKGICDTKFYGPLYCQKHKMMRLTTTEAQDLPEEDKTDFFKELQELGKFNFGNPADHEDRTPIDFSRIPKSDPNTPAFKPIVIPGRG